MGVVAFPCLPPKRNPAKQLVFHGVLCRVPGYKHHCHCSVQQVSWKHPPGRVLPLLTYKSDFSGRATLRYIPVDNRSTLDNLVESKKHVHRQRFCYRGTAAWKNSRWISIPFIQMAITRRGILMAVGKFRFVFFMMFEKHTALAFSTDYMRC